LAAHWLQSGKSAAKAIEATTAFTSVSYEPLADSLFEPPAAVDVLLK
jgi:ABC-type cobalt transport system substrate-binding protein